MDIGPDKLNLNTSANFREPPAPKTRNVKPAVAVEPKVQPMEYKAAKIVEGEEPDYKKLYEEAIAARTAPAPAKAPVKDLWDVMVKYTMPRGNAGENQMIPVSVGEYEAYFKRGKEITLPYPAYLVLRQTIKSEEAHAVLSQEMQGDFKIGER